MVVVVVGGRRECVILTDKMLWLSCFLSLKSVPELEGGWGRGGGEGGGDGLYFAHCFLSLKSVPELKTKTKRRQKNKQKQQQMFCKLNSEC